MSLVGKLLVVFALGVGASVAFVAAGDRARPASDYLIPVDSRALSPELAEYDRVLQAELAVVRGDVATYVAKPSFEPESAAMISSVSADEHRFPLTCTYSNQNLWYHGRGESEQPQEPITIHRVDVQLSHRAAAAVRKAWLGMLRLPRRDSECCLVDGKGSTFSARDVDHEVVLLGAGHYPSGGRAEDLDRIGEHLLEYCRADDERRAALESVIISESRALARRTWHEDLMRRVGINR